MTGNSSCDIIKACGGTPSHVFSGLDLLNFRRPCVYIWARGSEILYIGKGSNGVTRPLDPGHHRLRNDAILATDAIYIFNCDEGTEEIIERQLIAALAPKLNGRGEVAAVRDAVVSADHPSPFVIATLKDAHAQLTSSTKEHRKKHTSLLKTIDRLESRASEAEATLQRERALEDRFASGPVEQFDWGPVCVVIDENNEDSILADESLDGLIGLYDGSNEIIDDCDELLDEGLAEHKQSCRTCSQLDSEDYTYDECSAASELIDYYMGEVVLFLDKKGLYFHVLPLSCLRHVPERKLPDWLRPASGQ